MNASQDVDNIERNLKELEKEHGVKLRIIDHEVE